MRPTEFYALPTKRSEPWHRSYETLATLFDDETLTHELERESAATAGAEGLAFEQKLFTSTDGERSVSYEAATFEGRPFAIVVRSGRGGEDNKSRHVTDVATYEAARAYVEGWRARGTGLDADVAPADEDLDILWGTYGHAVMARSGGVGLVPVDHIAESGKLLFDRDAFDVAFDGTVRPAFRDAGQEFRDGIAGRRMRDLAVPALLEGVPEGVRATDDFDEIPKVPGVTPINGWSPVLLGAEDGTYALGVLGGNQGYFSWAAEIRAEKVGPPELYDELARGSAPSP